MDCGIYGIGLDATSFRNLGGMINHSDNPNAESNAVVAFGVEQPLIIAKTQIKKGEQIFIDYGKKFWKKSKEKPQDLSQIMKQLPI